MRQRGTALARRKLAGPVLFIFARLLRVSIMRTVVSVLVGFLCVQGLVAFSLPTGRISAECRGLEAPNSRRDIVNRWLSGAVVGAAVIYGVPAPSSAAAMQIEDLYPMLDKLREDILEDKKKAAILKTLKQLSSKDYLIAIVDSEHAKFQDVTYQQKDLDDALSGIDQSIMLLSDFLVEPSSPDKKAMQIYAFRQVTNRLEGQVRSLEKLVTGRETK
uniref:Uncharacterized protein n=1 Tax=Pinguiococcus pyrenoidosus TaxID=172671 RepID=A0A7R9UCC5_9STRA|mmetsp:Transcript_4971/g.19888  ORF Transcript_4971/g.19888 Transcript_4971/m.19888 type:complete len:217 (+) Transcript_4971:1-651(+)